MLFKYRHLLIKELSEFIQNNPDPRELKRALAVQMVIQEYTYFEIRDVLQVSVGFISKYKQLFKEQGIAGLTLKHQGESGRTEASDRPSLCSIGYLETNARLAVIEWLHHKNYWNLSELQHYILSTYNVMFASKSRYYDLFTEAGISWKKTQKRNPKLDQDLVKKNRKLLTG